MTPPRPPPPAVDHPTPDNLRPLRAPTLADVAAKVDALARDQRQHEVAEKDHRDLLGRQHVEIVALREIALEYGERLERAEQAILAEVVPMGRAIAVVRSEQTRTAATVSRVETALDRIAGIVGEPGDPDAIRHLSLTDMTPEQAEEAIRRAKLGSGLCRRDAEDVIRDAQRDRRLVKDAARGASLRTLGGAIGTGLAAAVAHDPAGAVDFIRSIFGG